MPKKNSGVFINLAKGRGETFFDRFLFWALNAGRVIVILTEVLALGAFLYRFSLDRKLSDLHDRIVQEDAVVKLLKNNEATFRNLQDRLSLAKTVIANTSTVMTTFTNIVDFIPADVTVRSISYSGDSIRIDATAQSISSLTSVIDKLKAYPTISTVSVDRIDNRTSTGIIAIVVSATFKKQPGGLTTGGGTQQ